MPKGCDHSELLKRVEKGLFEPTSGACFGTHSFHSLFQRLELGVHGLVVLFLVRRIKNLRPRPRLTGEKQWNWKRGLPSKMVLHGFVRVLWFC